MLEMKLPIFGTIFFILGLFFLLYLFVRILRSILQKNKKSKRRVNSQSSVVDSSLFIIALVFLLFSWFFFWTGRSLRGFHTFYPQTQVGEMEVIPETQTASRLVLTFFGSNGKSYIQSLFISGDKLQIEAEYLNFKPWVKGLGVYPCYKIVRINVLDISDHSLGESRVTPIISEGFPKDSSSIEFELLEGGTDLFFWTEKFDKVLPWVQTKVLKSEYFSIAQQVVKKIYITEEKIDLS